MSANPSDLRDPGEFFSLSHFSWRQPVNQGLCIALMCAMCFWVVFYYFIHRTEAFGDVYAADTSVIETGLPGAAAAHR